MQYPFTEEQRAIGDLTREFMEREVAPVAAGIDARPDPRDCYPGELINKASRVGLRTIAIPEEYGGIEADTTTKTLSLWTGGQIEIGTIKCLSQCWKISTAISKCGTQAQKDKWLKMFAEDDDCVCSIVLTEPEYGSDNLLRQPDPALGMRTSAVRDGDHYVINGTKRFTSLTSFSKIVLLLARTDPKAPVHQGTTAFLVHGEEEGISYGRVHNKLGYRLYPNAESFYDNVRVHKDDVVGEVNGGFDVFASVFRGSAELTACNTGLARGLFNVCHAHAKERIQGGKAHHRAPHRPAHALRDAHEHRGGGAVHVAHLLGGGGGRDLQPPLHAPRQGVLGQDGPQVHRARNRHPRRVRHHAGFSGREGHPRHPHLPARRRDRLPHPPAHRPDARRPRIRRILRAARACRGRGAFQETGTKIRGWGVQSFREKMEAASSPGFLSPSALVTFSWAIAWERGVVRKSFTPAWTAAMISSFVGPST